MFRAMRRRLATPSSMADPFPPRSSDSVYPRSSKRLPEFVALPRGLLVTRRKDTLEVGDHGPYQSVRECVGKHEKARSEKTSGKLCQRLPPQSLA